MLELAMATLQLLVVQHLKPAGDAGLEVTFHTSERATLRSAHADYERCERLLRQSCDRQRPVGISLWNGEVRQVVRADNDVVHKLVERSPDRVDVWFLGHDGIFHFDRSHPRAKRIYDTLAESKRSGSRVWFVAALPDLLIVDVASEDELPRPLEILEGTLTLSDGQQIRLGRGVVTLNPDPQERLRCWQMEYRTDSEFLHRFAELAHIPQRIELYTSGGQRWRGRTLISSALPDRIRFIGYGPLEIG